MQANLKPKFTQDQLLLLLRERIFDCLSNSEIPPRDLASIGNLVLNLQRREDDIAAAKEQANGIIAFPALPPIPQETRRALKAV